MSTNGLSATPRSRLFRAIISTNLVGMPALLVFIFLTLGVFSRHALQDFELDPFFLPVTFALLMTVSVLLVTIHYFQVIRTIKPIEDFLDARSKKGGATIKAAREAFAVTEGFPAHAFKVSVFYYLIGTPMALAPVNIAYCFTIRQTYSLFFGVLTTGVLISIFQLFTTRKALGEVQALLLDDYPELLIEDVVAKGFLGIRAKYVSAIVTLAMVMVTLTAAATINNAYRALLIQTATLGRAELAGRAEGLEEAAAWGGGPAELYDIAEKMSLDDRDLLYVLDKDLGNYFGNDLDPRVKQLARLLLGGEGAGMGVRKPRVNALGEGLYSAVTGFDQYYGVIHLPLDLTGNDAHLFVLVPKERFTGPLRGLDKVIWFGLVIGGLVLALVYGKLSSDDVRGPLYKLMDSLGALAEGDLTAKVTVAGGDEFGVLARSQARALAGLKRLVDMVAPAARELEKASRALTEQARGVESHSEGQADKVEETSLAVDDMKVVVEGIAESVHTLASATEESSASIIEVQATIEQVDTNVDNLSSSVIDTTASMQEMSTSVKQVAENVQFLKKRSDEAMEALREVERMIGRVTKGSKETRAITDRVAEDARRGVEAMNMTIVGIDRIKETSGAVGDVIGRLGARAREIGAILNVIDDVTEETSLLALNAAIIAAQAGEHGRGFAVVADEIKDLADRTASSTNEIAELINAVREEAAEAVSRMADGSASIDEGVKLSEQAGKALRQIQYSVEEALEQTRTIASAAEVQTEKARQLTEFMDGVDNLITEVAQATLQQKQSGEQILQASEKMREITRMVKRATTEQTQGSKQITQSIEHISDIAAYINSSQRDQLRSVESASAAVRKIKEAADYNRQRVAEMNTSIADLEGLARELDDLIKEFKTS